MNKLWDAIVIGAGPAGASCAVWLKQLGLRVLLVEEAAQPGGLLRTNSYLDVWTVTSPGQTGQDMAHHLARQIEIAGLEMRCLTQVRNVEKWRPDDASAVDVEVDIVSIVRSGRPVFKVKLSQFRADRSSSDREGDADESYFEFARHVVVASGVRARGPEGLDVASVPGILVGPGEHVMQYPFQGLSVAVLGGGDNAFENYLYARGQGARKVKLFARTVRAQQQFIDQVPTGDVVIGQVVLEPDARKVNAEQFDCILVFYGWEPRADFVQGMAVGRDARGFIRVDPDTTETDTPGLYAIGEVTQRMHPCVPTAMADGVIAAKAIERRLRNDASRVNKNQ